MANIKSAIKRVETTNKKRAQNGAQKAEMRSMIKRVETLVEENDAENAKTALQSAKKHIDKAVQKGLIHKNNGNRQKSNLDQKVKGLGA